MHTIVCNQINTTDATSGAGAAYLSGATDFTPSFSGVRVTRSLVFYACFVEPCLSFCTFLLAIVLSVLLRYTDSDYPFGIFKLLLDISFVLTKSSVCVHVCFYCNFKFRNTQFILFLIFKSSDVIFSYSTHEHSQNDTTTNWSNCAPRLANLPLLI